MSDRYTVEEWPQNSREHMSADDFVRAKQLADDYSPLLRPVTQRHEIAIPPTLIPAGDAIYLDVYRDGVTARRADGDVIGSTRPRDGDVERSADDMRYYGQMARECGVPGALPCGIDDMHFRPLYDDAAGDDVCTVAPDSARCAWQELRSGAMSVAGEFRGALRPACATLVRWRVRAVEWWRML